MSRAAGPLPVPVLAPDLIDRLRVRLASSPALQWLQPTLEELELDACVLKLRYRPELTNGSPAIHGGVLATLADTAVAFALSTNFDGKMGFATADMTIHFLRRANIRFQQLGHGRSVVGNCRRRSQQRLHVLGIPWPLS